MFNTNLNFVLEKDLQNVEELLTAIARNEGRKKIFPQILKKNWTRRLAKENFTALLI